jgi:putative aldouronate transport system substrate-binding protein
MDPLESIDDLYAYMAAIAADQDSGVQYAYNASQNGQFLEDMIAVTGNNLIKVNDYFYYQYEEGKTDYSADDVFFLYDSDFYKEFAQEMKTAAEAGDWSMSSINNQTDVRDSFLNGTSAVYIQNLGTAGGACNSMLQTNPDWEPELYDLNMDKVSIGAYDSDGYAVPYTSKNPERALMALDVLKNNKEAYTDIRYGIPGYHITRNDDGTWSQAEHYGTWSYGAAPSWGLKNTTLEMDQQGTFQTQLDIMDKWKEISVQSPTVGFAFSTTDVSDAWAAMTDVKTQYVPLLQLGLADDIDSTIAELDAQAQAAGIDEIKQAMADQLTAYFSEKTTE